MSFELTMKLIVVTCDFESKAEWILFNRALAQLNA
jgi:hypothetical protein